MTIHQEDLIATNEQIWASMLGLTLVGCDEDLRPTLHAASAIGACVQLVGEWRGAVCVDCSLKLAERATRLFRQESDIAINIEDVRDSVGELANMAAGGLKTLLPQPTHLSLPSVADGTDFDVSIRSGRILLQCAFQCEGEPLMVTLVEQEPPSNSGRAPAAVVH